MKNPNVLLNTAMKKSRAILSFAIKKSVRKKNSFEQLSSNANCSLRNKLSRVNLKRLSTFK